MTGKLTYEETEEIVDKIYKHYGTGTGCLFGLHPGQRDVAGSIVRALLRIEGRG